jgi:hypothetical protein
MKTTIFLLSQDTGYAAQIVSALEILLDDSLIIVPAYPAREGSATTPASA